MPYIHERTIRLAETDAAGIVFFANHLVLCHEAYEEALASVGLPVQSFIAEGDIIVPVTRSSVDYLRPLRCGDRVRIELTPSARSEHSFAIDYTIVRLGAPEKVAARAHTEHMCTSRNKHERVALPPQLAAWVAQG